ncbi:ORC ubiquitin ligase 1-like isoform X2 [Gigantopelta aegis]|uniref:ORC ubiquitin ligase 1-like isoform X2 n=1 Tax=Gigantopelta aegis TaxID=1735272 RepID=UPI001B88AD3D|nr:ORC ubiquitin ligase 1-like isoform X2 [Gigantopelta aegis]
MAAGMKARSNRTLTASSTLPISCQICLDTVKQPVLCTNNHVFCSACMDVWLKRNSHCPACRTSISPNNPVKQIIGGLEHYQDDKSSNAALRKTRFDLLYKEYEDEFEKLQSESMLLKAENDILKGRLKSSSGSSQLVKDMDKPISTADTNKLMIITKKLEDTQKWNVRMKEESTRLKRENSKLKDENVYLSRENEKLKIELSSRSPHKYGRITVATLESQVEKYEKEIQLLQKALERSDKYIAELENMKSVRGDGGNSVTSKDLRHKIDLASKDKFDSLSGFGYNEVSGSKRQLFGDEENGLSTVHFPVFMPMGIILCELEYRNPQCNLLNRCQC